MKLKKIFIASKSTEGSPYELQIDREWSRYDSDLNDYIMEMELEDEVTKLVKSDSVKGLDEVIDIMFKKNCNVMISPSYSAKTVTVEQVLEVAKKFELPEQWIKEECELMGALQVSFAIGSTIARS